MLNLFKLIKTMGNSETLTLFVDNEDENKLGILITNSEKNSQTVYKLNLLDINDENINIPPAEFEDIHYRQHVPTEVAGTQTNQPA